MSNRAPDLNKLRENLVGTENIVPTAPPSTQSVGNSQERSFGGRIIIALSAFIGSLLLVNAGVFACLVLDFVSMDYDEDLITTGGGIAFIILFIILTAGVSKGESSWKPFHVALGWLVVMAVVGFLIHYFN